MWVPDLERAIVFFRDVLGFNLHSKGELVPKRDSVLLDLFNIEAGSNIPRALFSSSKEERVLFVMETDDALQYQTFDKRPSAMVIQTDNLAAVKKRAKAYGFVVGNSNVDANSQSKQQLHETTIIGPGGQAVLVYELAR